MNKRNIIVLAIVVLAQTSVMAQTDSLRVDAEIGVRGKWQTGNFAQFVINPNARMTIEEKRTLIELQANYEFLKVNQGSLINDFWTYGMYQYNSKKTVFPMAIIHYGFAQAYAIDVSLIGGAGGGVNLIKNDEQRYLQANVFTGYLNLKYENSTIHRAASVGSYVKLKFPIKKGLVYCIIDSHSYISLKNSDYRSFNGRMILVFQVAKSIGVNMTYRLVYNHNNPSVIENTNGKLVFGLSYAFH